MISIRFLGTGGARFVVARQIRASGGMWMQFGSTQMHVDPGPGALVRALSAQPPCVPTELDAIVLSHKHLDHAGDVNAMIEAMTQGGWRRRGALVAPQDAFEGEPIILPYARAFVEREIVTSEESGPFFVNDVEIGAGIRHRHGVETYGLHFRYDGTAVSYLPCTRFFPELVDHYRGRRPDVLIINVLRFRDTMDVDHLTYDDVHVLLDGIRPHVAVLTHFGTRMLERDPAALAAGLEDEFGIRVFAAEDNWTLDVDTAIASALA